MKVPSYRSLEFSPDGKHLVLTGSNKTYSGTESSCKSRKQMTQAARVFQAS
jgi:hypothetical protein